eukprot:3241329-Prymnesium_polylepis.3
MAMPRKRAVPLSSAFHSPSAVLSACRASRSSTSKGASSLEALRRGAQSASVSLRAPSTLPS